MYSGLHNAARRQWVTTFRRSTLAIPRMQVQQLKFCLWLLRSTKFDTFQSDGSVVRCRSERRRFLSFISRLLRLEVLLASFAGFRIVCTIYHNYYRQLYIVYAEGEYHQVGIGTTWSKYRYLNCGLPIKGCKTLLVGATIVTIMMILVCFSLPLKM